MIIRTIRKETFTNICNDLLNDCEISFRGKGLLCYLISRPPNWNANVCHLAKNFKEGKDAIYSIINELIEAGYITRIILKDEKGRHNGVEYHVYETKEPKRDIPEVAIPEGEKPDNNKDGSLISKEVKKEISPQEQLRQKKISFMKLVIDWGIEHPNKYPKLLYKQFVIYWTEQAISKKIKLRYEDQKFFDVGRRLATWFSKSQDTDITKMWEEEKKLPSVNEIFKEILGVNGKQ